MYWLTIHSLTQTGQTDRRTDARDSIRSPQELRWPKKCTINRVYHKSDTFMYWVHIILFLKVLCLMFFLHSSIFYPSSEGVSEECFREWTHSQNGCLFQFSNVIVVPARSTVYRWHKLYKQDRESVLKTVLLVNMFKASTLYGSCVCVTVSDADPVSHRTRLNCVAGGVSLLIFMIHVRYHPDYRFITC